MFGSGLRTCFWILLATYCAVATETIAQQPTVATIVGSAQNNIDLSVVGSAPIILQSTSPLNQTLNGSEQSECKPYGRQTSAFALADSQVTTRGTSLTAKLQASATAIGGHYRTCVAGCLANNCLGIIGNDTTATSTASTAVHARVQFAPSILQDYFDLHVATTGSENLNVKVTDPRGQPVSLKNGVATVKASPNDVYYLDATLSNSSSNSGGCCKDEKGTTVQLDAWIEKPPILTAKQKLQPYIVGGKQTSSYKYVAALMLDGKLHCSGTVVSEHSILTAAHCINGYEDAIKMGRMTFLLGSVVTAPDYGPQAIVDGTYPRGADPIQYSPTTYLHDVGIVYSDIKIPSDSAQLHAGVPPWSGIVNQLSLIFVGFGYNKDDHDQFVGIGIKREAPWPTNRADDWRFYFKVFGQNTCSGDSGGPAFYQNETTRGLVLVGITSGGDPNCTWGADTRVDSHHDWIESHLK